MTEKHGNDAASESRLDEGRSYDDTVVVIATYNEIENLPRLVDAIFRLLPIADVLVVDDASPDGTGEWVQTRSATEARLHLLSRQGKLGLGSAMIDGLRWCLDRDYQFLVNMDADFSHPPRYLPELIDRVRSDHNVDVAIASRYVRGGSIHGWPNHRRWMSRMVNGFARLWFALPPRDCSGSFRCYRASTIREMDVDQIVSQGYAFYEEILWRLRKIGARMVEVPYTFQDRTKGETKLNLVESLRSIITLMTLRWR